MANYGRGREDDYGSQSSEVMDAEFDRSERDYYAAVLAAQNRNRLVRDSEASASKESR